MLENRIILTTLIGWCLGIIWGLYFNFSIALFYFIIFFLYLIFKKETHKISEFKLISFRRYFRYVKIIFTKKVIKNIVIFSIISNLIVLFQNYQYDNLYKNLDDKEIKIQGIVLEQEEQRIKIKVENEPYKNTYLYVYIKNQNFEYGDEIDIFGKFNLPKTRTNYKGFDYRKYLKTLKIYGIVYANKIQILQKDKGNFLLKYTKKLTKKIETIIDTSNLSDEEKAITKGVILGDKTDLSEESIEDFSESNISYALAVSGMHVSYVILISSFVLNRLIGKHYSKIITIIIIFVYMCVTSFSPSVVRAGITGIIVILAGVFYRKNDIFTSISIPLLIILIYNPYLIQSTGVQLSFTGTIGIILISQNLNKLVDYNLKKINKKAIRRNNKNLRKIIKVLNTKFFKMLQNAVIVTLSASSVIIPIILISFNKVSILSLIISAIVSFIIGPIVILGMFFIIFKISLIQKMLSFFIQILVHIAEFGKKIPLNQIYLFPPNIVEILIYYCLVFFINYIIEINLEKNKTNFQIRFLNLVSLAKYKAKLNRKKLISIILIISLICNLIPIIPRNLRIYFIDVGQGDCTLIITPTNKTILIDGGGQENFDVGKKVLIPYLLNRKIMKIDYIINSHTDTDHLEGLLTVLKELKVKNVIIGKQYEDTENLQRMLNLVNDKNVNLYVVKAGDKLSIEKNLYFDILWPDENKMISENAINNNSLVCKLEYKKFSCIFTGDIEEQAEKEIGDKYGKFLKGEIIKIAHHGSKTSSTEEFLKLVKPKIALIGVGENNSFGHPSDKVLNLLQNMRHKSL